VGADGGDGAEARVRSGRGRRLIRGTLVVLAQAAGTLVVLGALSGTARADVAGTHDLEAPDQLAASHDVRVEPPGRVVDAGATIDGAGATVDASVAAFHASVAVDETGISLSVGSIERTHVPTPVDETPAHDGPDAPRVTVAGSRGNPRLTSDGDDRSVAPTPDDWFSISAAAGRYEGAVTSSRHPLGRQLHASAATAGAAATSSEDRPDMLGLLARWSLPHDGAPRPFRSVITVLTSELVASTGPPG
jgi:hypothetical protein